MDMVISERSKRLELQTVLRFLMALLLCASAVTGSVNAQEKPMVFGASALFELPLGSLHDRYLGAPGFMVFAGVASTPQMTWIGKFEYAEFSSVNTDKVKKSVTIGSGIGAQKISLPLPKLTMELKTASLTAEAQMGLLRSEIADVNGVIGFGFTNWVNTRSAYNDSLFTTDGSGTPVKAAVLAVPAIRQEDWSGTFNLGLEVTMQIIEPVWFTAGANYKLIVGELWQTLDLDLENVAGMQFLSLRAGVKVML